MNEVQTISTTADVLPAIQSVTTSANPGSVLNSEFTLELDLTSTGGASELSDQEYLMSSNGVSDASKSTVSNSSSSFSSCIRISDDEHEKDELRNGYHSTKVCTGCCFVKRV